MKNTLFLLAVLITPFYTALAEHKVFDVDNEINYKEPWYNKSKSEEENFKRIITGLSASTAGKLIIQKASAKAAQRGLTLNDVIAVGEGSLTDTTLVRKFSAINPNQVTFETRSKVYLNRHLTTLDAMLDFAHELTHFTYREAFNPYDSHFSLKDFIKSTVEGRGGEVDAFMVECRVLKELMPSTSANNPSCSRLFDKTTGSVSKVLGIQEFYKVGRHYDLFKRDLEKFALNEKDLPEASSAEAYFISSAWGLPYPVAAIKEYTNIMDKVCKNDQNRLTLLQNKLGRSPASANADEYDQRNSQLTYQTMFEDFKVRCKKFASN